LEGHRVCYWRELFGSLANVLKPKEYGELGVFDLERFSRALRIRWMWFQWSDPNQPWIGSEVPCSEVDMQFFRASTRVAIGNGQAALFWQSSWLSRAAPRDLAPSLYKLAWHKINTVVVDLANVNWLRGLWRMSTAVEIAEFISLWGLVQDVQPSVAPDSIFWRWTEHGSYNARSAYVAQFKGSYCTFNSTAIRRAQAEGKHRIFA
jgi:hypothetical protein